MPLSRPLDDKVTLLGNGPVSLNVGAGEPVAVTWNEPLVPTVKVVLFPLVMTGPWEAATTLKVKLCDATDPTPLPAVIVMG